jgi:hypothetical protein
MWLNCEKVCSVRCPFAGSFIDNGQLATSIERARIQFIETMTYTIIDDVAERLGWRFQSMSIAEVVTMMKTRELRAYHSGFEEGVAAKKRRSNRMRFDKIISIPRRVIAKHLRKLLRRVRA